MKRALLLLGIAMLLGAASFSLIREDTGYVLIAWGDTSVETSLWLALLLLLAFLGLVIVVGRLLSASFRLGRRVSKGLIAPSANRARKLTARGLMDFIEGNWQEAQRKLVQAASHSGMPVINYLAAARSAYELNDQNSALKLLHKAEQSDSQSDLAVALTQARMQLMAQSYEECLATLERVKRKAPQHPTVLDLRRQVYLALGDWQALKTLLPSLSAYGPQSPEALASLTQEVYAALLQQAGKEARGLPTEQARERLTRAWRDCPAKLRQQPQLVAVYAQQLNANRRFAEAEKLLYKHLQKTQHPVLVRAYGQTPGPDAHQQLSRAETWLKKHPQDPELLLALGRLCLRSQLWGKARDYFQQSLRRHPTPETCAELGRLTASLGEHQQSTHYYQQGLLLTTETLPELPQPKTPLK